jgi:hypothetical protein
MGASEFLSRCTFIRMDANLGDTRSIWAKLDFGMCSRERSQTSSLYRIASELQALECHHHIIRWTAETYKD